MSKEITAAAAAAAGAAFLGGLFIGSVVLRNFFVAPQPSSSSSALSSSCSSLSSSSSAFLKDPAYVLVVKLKLKAGSRQQFIDIFRPLAAFCEQKEPYTITYSLSTSEKDPDTIMIYERYRNKDDLKITHDGSKEKAAFGELLAKSGLIVEKSLEEYMETGVGYAFR
jgi:quinol monooxygenase YgiN